MATGLGSLLLWSPMSLCRFLKRVPSLKSKLVLNFSTTSLRGNEKLKKTITESVEEEDKGLKSMDHLLQVVSKSGLIYNAFRTFTSISRET